MIKKLKVKDKYFISIPRGEDFIEFLTNLAKDNAWKAGQLNFIGALEEASVAEYDQKNKKYLDPVVVKKDSEILSIMGNITLKEGLPFVHVHASLAINGGEKCIGGHLNSAKVFAAEGVVEVFEDELERKFDNDRGLSLL